MKNLLVTSLALVALTAQAAENWKPIASSIDRSTTFFVDQTSFKAEGTTVEFILRSDSKTAPHTAYWRVECKDRTAKILFLKYDNKVVVGPMVVEPEPGNVADLIVAYACEKVYI